MADEKKPYLVKSRLDHDKRYEDGDKVHLTEAEAAPLLSAKVVEPHTAKAAAAAADATATETPLHEMTKPDLLTLAAELGLEIAGNALKDVIVKAIADHRKKNPPPATEPQS